MNEKMYLAEVYMGGVYNSLRVLAGRVIGVVSFIC